MNEVYKVENILKKIEEYNIDYSNCINFLLQEKGRKDDFVFFYYKSAIFQLLQCREHLDKMIAYYYGSEDADLISEQISNIYKSFFNGDNKELKKVLNSAKTLTNEFVKLYKNKNTNIYLSSLPTSYKDFREEVKKLDNYIFDKYCLSLELKKEQQFIQDDDKLLIDFKKKTLIKRIKNNKTKKIIKNNIKLSTEKVKKLKNEINYYNKKIEEQIQSIQTFAVEHNIEYLLEKLNIEEARRDNLETEDYLSIRDVFALRLHNYYTIAKGYHQLPIEIINMTKIIQNYNKITNTIKETKDLRATCLIIRNLLFGENDLEFRLWKLEGVNDLMRNTSLPKNIESDFNKLCEEFQNTLNEKDEELFIRKVADFHYNFILVHPFHDGNGRTSRILLTTMLMSRNIMLPNLYYDTYEKGKFYRNSDTALDGDYTNIEQSLFEKLTRYYPLVIPQKPSNNSKKK